MPDNSVTCRVGQPCITWARSIKACWGQVEVVQKIKSCPPWYWCRQTSCYKMKIINQKRFYLARKCSPTQGHSSGLQTLRMFLELGEVDFQAASSITQSSGETALYKADPISYITVEQQSHADMDTCKAWVFPRKITIFLWGSCVSWYWDGSSGCSMHRPFASKLETRDLAGGRVVPYFGETGFSSDCWKFVKVECFQSHASSWELVSAENTNVTSSNSRFFPLSINHIQNKCRGFT